VMTSAHGQPRISHHATR